MGHLEKYIKGELNPKRETLVLLLTQDVTLSVGIEQEVEFPLKNGLVFPNFGEAPAIATPPASPPNRPTLNTKCWLWLLVLIILEG